MRIFIHGLESTNQGAKSIFFRKQFPDMVIPLFTGDLAQRMDKLNEILKGRSGITLVGSSFGGLMATLFAMEEEPKVSRLILLAPALNFIEASEHKIKKISSPTWIFHGTNDDVIPLKAVEGAFEKYFVNFTFTKTDDDHFLHKTFETIDWPMLLASDEAACSNKAL